MRSTAGAARPAASVPAARSMRRREGLASDDVVMTSSRKVLLRIRRRRPVRFAGSAGGASMLVRHPGKSMLVRRPGERRLLLGRGILLVLLPPFVIGHAVDSGTALILAQGQAPGVGRLLHPVGQAVAAEAGEIHQIDVLHVGARARVLDQAPEYGGFELGAGLVVEIHGKNPPRRLPGRYGGAAGPAIGQKEPAAVLLGDQSVLFAPTASRPRPRISRRNLRMLTRAARPRLCVVWKHYGHDQSPLALPLASHALRQNGPATIPPWAIKSCSIGH